MHRAGHRPDILDLPYQPRKVAGVVVASRFGISRGRNLAAYPEESRRGREVLTTVQRPEDPHYDVDNAPLEGIQRFTAKRVKQ